VLGQTHENGILMLKTLETILIPVGAIFLSLLLFAIFIAFMGHEPFDVFHSLYRGAFGTWFSWQNTLIGAAPLMLTALCTALPARIGFIVIGGEGAVVVGGLCSALAGLALAGVTVWFALPMMLAMGFVCGGLWIMFIGYLRYYRGVNETISSLLLNYIAIAILSFLIFGPLRDPSTLNKPSTFAIDEKFLVGNMGETFIHWGFAYGVIFCLLYWFLLHKTTFGFSVDVTGGNVKAARISGLPVPKLILSTFFLGGAAAGLAGALEVIAVHGRANSSLNAGYGYEGILIAFIARHNPLAIIPVAILLGGIKAGNGLVQRADDLPDATGLVLQGIIFVVILASESLYGRIKFFQPNAESKEARV